jgi:hypothetical protein
MDCENARRPRPSARERTIRHESAVVKHRVGASGARTASAACPWALRDRSSTCLRRLAPPGRRSRSTERLNVDHSLRWRIPTTRARSLPARSSRCSRLYLVLIAFTLGRGVTRWSRKAEGANSNASDPAP